MKINARVRVAALAAGLALLTAGCGGTEPAASSATDETDSSNARSLLPADIRDAGTLELASGLSYPPFGMRDDQNKPSGIDVEIMTAISKVLGLELTVTDVPYSGILTGVAGGRYDVGMNQITDTVERRKQVNFVDYYASRFGVMQGPGASGVVKATELCGISVALTVGTTQQPLVERISKACVDAGKDPVDIMVFPESGATNLAVESGQADVYVTAMGVGRYGAAHKPAFKMGEGTIPDSEQIAGIVVSKDEPELTEAIHAALQQIIDDGTYASILESYDVADEAIDEAMINGGDGI
jgi:polar amino acid transport system substrate-binding protein